MRRLIVGCGYLGRRVAALWTARGDAVAALTRSEKNAAELRIAGIEPIVGDVTLPETLSALPQVDTLLYAVGLDRSAGKSMREVYVDGLRNVLQHISGHARQFLYISSTSVYGQNDGEWIDENSPTEPTRDNGRICLEAEQLVWEFFPPDSAHANILRLAGIYGPGRLLRRIEAVRSGEPVIGNPDAYLNLIHVDDAAQSVLACSDNGRAGRTYLISDDCPVTRREYYEMLAELLDAPAPEFASGEESPGITGLNKRCRNRRMHEELGVTLRYPTLREGLPQALAAG